MPRGETPGSIKSPLSTKADYADPHLYGGASFLVGILGLVIGLVLLLLGNTLSGTILGVLGLALMAGGFWMSRRGA